MKYKELSLNQERQWMNVILVASPEIAETEEYLIERVAEIFHLCLKHRSCRSKNVKRIKETIKIIRDRVRSG